MSNKTTIIRAQKGFQEQFVRTNVDICIGGGVLNCGKAQPLDCKIFTPCGSIRMGDLKIGDTICDANGGTQMVLNIYEKGFLDSYKITFDDGTSTKCCDEHLWNVLDTKKQKEITITLRDIINNGIDRYRFPLCKPIEFTKKELPIEPYLLGVILGDAHIFRNRNSSLTIATDEEIIQRAYFQKEFSYTKHVPCNRATYFTITEKDIREKIISLGLMGTLSDTKFIPKEYLFSSIEQRTELLRGLFDTDGYNDKKSNRIEYTTTSENLRDDVCFLVRSLGGKATVGEKIGHYRNENGEKIICKKAYRIQCRFNDRNDFITLQRKKIYKDKVKEINKKISSIEHIGREEMRCIWVSSKNHLYITDDFIVTHNTFAAIMSIAEAVKDPRFRGLFLRNNLGDAKAGGGLVDTFKEVYGRQIHVIESQDPKIVFPSGAYVDITHVADQNVEKINTRFKGRQYDYIYFDEGTGFTWECFTNIASRNRGKASWSGHIQMTTNPEREHWLRKFLDWYIGPDGLIRPDRNGVVRYFFTYGGNTVNDVVWGDSKEEVYKICKSQIDADVISVYGKDEEKNKDKWKNFIKSFVFYLGKMSENIASIGNNEGYAGTVAMAGGAEAKKKLEGNWNVSNKDDENVTISLSDASACLVQEPQTNNDKWITCDLADTGTDNFVAISWDGFHITDIKIKPKTMPRENAEILHQFASEMDISDNHIIFDGIRGIYINDYIEDAVPFFSYASPIGLYKRRYRTLKDECYARLIEVIKRHQLSFRESVINRPYYHQLIKETLLIENEFLEECYVVKYKESSNGKLTLLNKKEMNQQLGKGRSMDLLDPIAMRMYPLAELPYGDELVKTMVHETEMSDYEKYYAHQTNEVNLFDNSFFC